MSDYCLVFLILIGFIAFACMWANEHRRDKSQKKYWDDISKQQQIKREREEADRKSLMEKSSQKEQRDSMDAWEEMKKKYNLK